MRSLCLLLALCLLASCRGAPDTPAVPPRDGPAAETEPAPDPAREQPDRAEEPGSGRPADTALDEVAVALTTVARLSSPTSMASRAGDDALYVGERAGRVRAVRDGSADDEPLLDLSEETTTDGERGLLGLVFAPDGQALYVSLTDRAGDSLVLRYRMDGGGGVDAGSRAQVLTVEQPFANHNGGHLAFGPDGYLYYGLGDGGGAGDPLHAGQDPGTLLGSLLRLDPAGPGDGYAVPADNPFVDDARGRDEVWAFGLRNPWRFAFDSETGDLWVADVGQDDREEINFAPAGQGAGANYGWSAMEGTRDFDGSGAPAGHVPPVFEYDRAAGRCSITGGVVYRGEAIPALAGTYLFSDLCDGVVRALEVSGGSVTGERDLGVGADQVVSFGQDAAGEVYVLSLTGEVARLDPQG